MVGVRVGVRVKVGVRVRVVARVRVVEVVVTLPRAPAGCARAA